MEHNNLPYETLANLYSRIDAYERQINLKTAKVEVP